MSITVYWSPWGEQEQYASRFLSYQTPDRLVDGLKQFRNDASHR